MSESINYASALVDALAGEHRLRRQAQREQVEADRWVERVHFAQARELADLARDARLRADRHLQQAQAMREQAALLHLEVERLRAVVAVSHGPGPPVLVTRRDSGS